MDSSAFLPIWIIGAPLLAALVDRFTTPSVSGSGTARLGATDARTPLPTAR